jgi:hypothetical protein
LATPASARETAKKVVAARINADDSDCYYYYNEGKDGEDERNTPTKGNDALLISESAKS